MHFTCYWSLYYFSCANSVLNRSFPFLTLPVLVKTSPTYFFDAILAYTILSAPHQGWDGTKTWICWCTIKNLFWLDRSCYSSYLPYSFSQSGVKMLPSWPLHLSKINPHVNSTQHWEHTEYRYTGLSYTLLS